MSAVKEPPIVTFKVVGRQIHVSTLYEHKDRCKAIDGARWNPELRCWYYPADHYTASALREAFRGLGRAVADSSFRDLLSESAIAPEPIRSEPNQTYTGPMPKTMLWQHQLTALDKALSTPSGFYYAHDMGAGKSLTAIATMLRMECQKILIVCPKRVITSWRDQFERHAQGMIVAAPLNKGTVTKRVETAKEWLRSYSPCAIILNYEALIQPAMKEWLLKQQWDIIILDEAHRIKSPGGKQSKMVATLGRRAKYRLCLSGTPFPHGPLDIYAQFRFLAPDVFGTNYNQFKARYAITNPNMHDQVVEYINQDDLNAKFYSIADRVMTRDVIELPEERDEILYGDLSEKARKHYIELETLFWTELENMPDEPSEVSINNVLTRTLRLQQITSGFVRDDDGVDHQLDTTKADLLADLVEDMPQDEPLVLFAKFKHDLDTIRRVMAQAGRPYGEISGRHDDYPAWQAGHLNTIGVQLQAGGEGLNDLVRARYGVYVSVSHSLKDFNQSRARLIRPGQKQNVVFYHLVCRNTIDESIYNALSSRQELITALLKERKGTVTPAQEQIAAYVGDEMRHF